MVLLNELQNDPLLNDLLYTFCHHETVLKLYGNGQGDQLILLAPSTGQKPSFIERIEANSQGKKYFFLFYSSQCRVGVRAFEFLNHLASKEISPQRSTIIYRVNNLWVP